MDGAQQVCAVESVLSERDMKLKNRHWYNFGPKYLRAEFLVQIIIGAANLKFQIVGKDGVVSRGPDEVEVQWMLGVPETAVAGGPQYYRTTDMYPNPA
jgi:hypothetical protein